MKYQRSADTHQLLIDACRSLIQEGRIPSAVSIAERAGRGTRTVHHHFSSLDEIIEAAGYKSAFVKIEDNSTW